jgi:hypothetical protein
MDMDMDMGMGMDMNNLNDSLPFGVSLCYTAIYWLLHTVHTRVATRVCNCKRMIHDFNPHRMTP